MVFATFGHVRLPFCMVVATVWHFKLSFAWYLLHFGTSNVHVGFLRNSSGFYLGFHLGFHLGSHENFISGFIYGLGFRVSCRLSFKVSLGLGFFSFI